MRKYIIGGIIGFTLAFSLSAHAEDVISLVGKQIQGEFPVKVNGITLENKAGVVDGTSLVPLRAIGEALNMDVSFDADLGIELKKKDVEPVATPSASAKPSKKILDDPTPEGKISIIESTIEMNERYIKVYEANIKISGDDPAFIKKCQDEIERLKKANEELLKKKAELEAQ